MRRLLFTIIIFSFLIPLFSISKGDSDEQKITFSKGTKFTDVMMMLEEVALRTEGKKVVNLSSVSVPISISLNQVNWKQAIVIVAAVYDLEVEEKPGAIVLKDKVVEEDSTEEKKVSTSDEQVKISAVFFKADKSFLRSVGINWNSLADGTVGIDGSITPGDVADEILSARVSNSGTIFNDVRFDVEALIEAMESSQKGSVLARPSVSVLSGKIGYIQVGEDFSIKSTDDAGNTIDKFFSTGVIMNVEPTVIHEEGVSAIHLKTKVEKSSAIPGDVSTIIQKSQSTTEVLLFDKEQTVIGGLYDTDISYERAGIPFLKDLPWWVLGIKYLTGYSKEKKDTTEMIIILSAEIVPSLDDRIKDKISKKKQVDKVRKGFKDAEELFELE